MWHFISKVIKILSRPTFILVPLGLLKCDLSGCRYTLEAQFVFSWPATTAAVRGVACASQCDPVLQDRVRVGLRLMSQDRRDTPAEVCVSLTRKWSGSLLSALACDAVLPSNLFTRVYEKQVPSSSFWDGLLTPMALRTLLRIHLSCFLR